MKRKKKSEQQARAIPDRIVGGNDALMNRYAAESSSFRMAMAENSYNAGSTINTEKPGTSILSSRDKRSASINTRPQMAGANAAEEGEQDQHEDGRASNKRGPDAGDSLATDQLNQASQQITESGPMNNSAKESN